MDIIFIAGFVLLLYATVGIYRIPHELRRIHASQYDLVRLARRTVHHLEEIEKKIKAGETPVDLASVIEFYANIDGQITKVEHMFMKVSDALAVSLQIKDFAGNAAQIDGLPQWALTDAALGSLEVAEGGMSAVFKPAGPVGALKVQVSADADLGEGVKPIIGELDIDLLPGEAVSIELAAEVVA